MALRLRASFVRQDVVLTAAHCVDGSDGTPSRFRVLLGTRAAERAASASAR